MELFAIDGGLMEFSLISDKWRKSMSLSLFGDIQ